VCFSFLSFDSAFSLDLAAFDRSIISSLGLSQRMATTVSTCTAMRFGLNNGPTDGKEGICFDTHGIHLRPRSPNYPISLRIPHPVSFPPVPELLYIISSSLVLLSVVRLVS
jgi:hypothetical protein